MARKIEETPTVQQKVQEFQKRYRYFTLAYRALKWRLARVNIERSKMGIVDAKGIRYHKQWGDQEAGIPAILIAFVSLPGKSKVEIIDVHALEDSEERP